MSANLLLLVRHCEAFGQEPGATLTDAGFKQATALAAFLSDWPVDFLASSAYRRAEQSIGPFAAATGLQVHVDPRLNERTISVRPIPNWQGILRDSFDDPDLRGVDGESAREVLARAWDSLSDLLKAGHQLPLVVTHGNLMSLVLNSLDVTFDYQGWMSLSNPDVYLLRQLPDGAIEFDRLWNPTS